MRRLCWTLGFLKHIITHSDNISQSDLTLHLASTNDFEYQETWNDDLEKHKQNMSERHVTWGTVISTHTVIQNICHLLKWSSETTLTNKKPVEVLIKFYSKILRCDIPVVYKLQCRKEWTAVAQIKLNTVTICKQIMLRCMRSQHLNTCILY